MPDFVQYDGCNGGVALWRARKPTRDGKGAKSLRSRNLSSFSNKKGRCLPNVLLVKLFTLPEMVWLVVTSLSYSGPMTGTSVATSCLRPVANGYAGWRDLREYVHPDRIATGTLGVDGAYFLTKSPLPCINIGISPSSIRANVAANHRSAPNLPTPCH